MLHYVAEGKVLDMQTIAVPYRYTGQGLARLLAEVLFINLSLSNIELRRRFKFMLLHFQTAFTHAIVNHYYMYLTCEYMQKYYLAIKNPDLEERIVGPPHILEGPDSEPLDPDIIYELPDPEDFLIYSS